jgi:hypothetical protein
LWVFDNPSIPLIVRTILLSFWSLHRRLCQS